jgi:hypothetical protein
MHKKQLIFQPHPAGFFSNFNKVTHALSVYNEQVGEIVWQMIGEGMHQYHCDEVFSKLFKPYKEDVVCDESITVQRYIDVKYTAHHVAEVYDSSDQKWRHNLNAVFNKYIKFTDLLDQTWNNIFTKQFEEQAGTKIGILIRNNALNCEQPYQKLPEKQSYIDAIEQIQAGSKTVVCAIDNREDLAFFTEKYKCIYNEHVSRSNTASDPETHLHNQLSCIDAAYHFLEAYALSKCDYLIHPVSNISTAALYMNPKLQNVFLKK